MKISAPPPTEIVNVWLSSLQRSAGVDPGAGLVTAAIDSLSHQNDWGDVESSRLAGFASCVQVRVSAIAEPPLATENWKEAWYWWKYVTILAEEDVAGTPKVGVAHLSLVAPAMVELKETDPVASNQ